MLSKRECYEGDKEDLTEEYDLLYKTYIFNTGKAGIPTTASK